MKKIIFLLVVCAVALVGAFAQTSSPQLEQLQRDLREQQRIRDLSNSKASSLERDIRNLTVQEKTLNARVKALNLRLTKLEAERAATQEQLAKTEDKSQSLSLEIQMLEAKIAYGKQQLSKLLTTLDRERTSRYVRLMVRAANVFELAVKAKDLDLIQDVNLNVIDELNINSALLSSKNTEYQAVIVKLNEYQRLLESKTAEITQNRSKLNASIAGLQKTRAGRQALQLQAVRSAQTASANASSLFSNLVSERNRLAEIRRQRAIEAARLREEAAQRQREEAMRIARIRDQQARAKAAALEAKREARVQAQIARVEPIRLPSSPAPGNRLPSNVNGFIFPMPGGGIVSDFGLDGNDYMAIQGASGASVIAAADGTVVGVETIGANYGYYVLIAHTEDLDSLVTVYGNLQYPNVGPGQDVRRGQIIGNVGGGALFPSNELHFHVARNRVYVNPRPYL
jgi:murein DD-endopeptidase MepM/ murein hydrolase activator NlpD